jgi:hypothetical protein
MTAPQSETGTESLNALARRIDRFMKWVFWIGATSAVVFTATAGVRQLRLIIALSSGGDRVTNPIQESDSPQAKRGASFYKNAAGALAVQLRDWGFTTVDQPPFAGRSLPLLQSQKATWYGMSDPNTRSTRIWVCVALAQDSRGLSVWVIWPPPGIDAYVETMGHWWTQGLKGWWPEYLKSHPQSQPSNKGQ